MDWLTIGAIVVMCSTAVIAVLYSALRIYCGRLLKKFLRAPKPGSLGIDYGEAYELVCKRGDEWLRDNPERMVYITSRDGVTLAAHDWDYARRRTVVFVHGYGNTGIQATLVAPLLTEVFDANILAPDCRGHGESGGEYIGLGWPDRLDVIDWVNYVVKRQGEAHEVILVGLSMGGAAVLCASGESDLPKNVKVICSDCGFSSLSDMFKSILKDKLHLPAWPILPIINSAFKRMFGYSVYDVQTVAQVKRSTTPTLFIHGAADQFVPAKMARELYDACPAAREIFIVEGAKHALSAVVDAEGYRAAVSGFCGRYLSQ